MTKLPFGLMAKGETHGPNFDAFAQGMAEAGGAEIPKTAGDLAKGNPVRGQALESFGAAITRMSKHKGLPLNRDERRS